MGAFLGLFAVLCIAGLITAAAMQPVRSQLSRAELKRRSKLSEAGVLELDRYELYPGVITVLRSIRALLLVLATCFLIGSVGWFFGIIAALLLACVYPLIARLKIIQRGASKLYAAIEPRILDFVTRFERVLLALRDPAQRVHEAPQAFHSKEELAEAIEQSESALSTSERKLVASALRFGEKNVASVMTPRAVIDSIHDSEFVGPLVLDELHALGHSRLPVIHEDIDHIVGIVHLRDLLSLDVRESKTAEQLMEKKVYYIRHDDSLQHALAAFIKTRHHLFVVINESRETVGLLSLEDVLECLIGQKIIDEDDVHSDLRAVAARAGALNNRGEGHVDL